MLEVIAQSVEDVKIISQTKATRIELCTNLEADGLTPSIEFVKEVIKVTKVPLRIMVRPRNSFETNDQEVEEMCRYIKKLKQLEHPLIEGVVFGYLNLQKKQIDIPQIEKLIKVSKPLTITFHKASDLFINDLYQFQTLGIDSVLTQGGIEPILNNIENLTNLKNQKSNVELLLGGGIHIDNIAQLASISQSIHIGSLARINKSYQEPIDPDVVNEIVKIISEV